MSGASSSPALDQLPGMPPSNSGYVCGGHGLCSSAPAARGNSLALSSNVGGAWRWGSRGDKGDGGARGPVTAAPELEKHSALAKSCDGCGPSPVRSPCSPLFLPRSRKYASLSRMHSDV